MKVSVETSPIMQRRLAMIEEKTATFEDAIELRNFDDVARLTMDDSDELHEVCRSSDPPIRYLNESSE